MDYSKRFDPAVRAQEAAKSIYDREAFLAKENAKMDGSKPPLPAWFVDMLGFFCALRSQNPS